MNYSQIESIVEDFGHVTNPECVAVLERLKELPLTPSFEVAEAIVKERMETELAKLVAIEGSYLPSINLSICKFTGADAKARWKARVNIHRCDGNGFTLSECLSDLPPMKTPEQIKAERIAELESELAKLKTTQPE